MTMTSPVPWSPAGPDVEALPAGVWRDAARVPLYLGARALAELGDDTGAVILDPFGQHLYWLTCPGATGHWELPGIQPLGAATYVGVPPVPRTDGDGVRWLVPLTQDHYLTRADRLHAALAIAVETVPHRPTVAECTSCGNTTAHPVQVHDGQRGVDHACPYCAPGYEPGPGLRQLLQAAEPYRQEVCR